MSIPVIECPIKKPKDPSAQKSKCSTNTNKNTIKVLVGATPGGFVSYVSDSYGGSTSDRQIVERSALTSMCSPNGSIMADKGFSAQIIIRLAKTYRILVEPMTVTETRFSTEIVFICFMLCNFRKKHCYQLCLNKDCI